MQYQSSFTAISIGTSQKSTNFQETNTPGLGINNPTLTNLTGTTTVIGNRNNGPLATHWTSYAHT